jgi:hypothetical protein
MLLRHPWHRTPHLVVAARTLCCCNTIQYMFGIETRPGISQRADSLLMGIASEPIVRSWGTIRLGRTRIIVNGRLSLLLVLLLSTGPSPPPRPTPPSPPPPSPHDPTDSCPKPAPKWLQAALYTAAYAMGLISLAGYRAAGSYVGGRIAKLRQQHMGPGRPSWTDGGDGSYQVRSCTAW